MSAPMTCDTEGISADPDTHDSFFGTRRQENRYWYWVQKCLCRDYDQVTAVSCTWVSDRTWWSWWPNITCFIKALYPWYGWIMKLLSCHRVLPRFSVLIGCVPFSILPTIACEWAQDADLCPAWIDRSSPVVSPHLSLWVCSPRKRKEKIFWAPRLESYHLKKIIATHCKPALTRMSKHIVGIKWW